MGCKATWRVRSLDELRGALTAIHASPANPALAEEFLRGQEHSFETITIGGQVGSSRCRYYPTPLEVMETRGSVGVRAAARRISSEWADARELGVRAVTALGPTPASRTWVVSPRRRTLAIGEIAAIRPAQHRADE
jgi:hypothetical protein